MPRNISALADARNVFFKRRARPPEIADGPGMLDPEWKDRLAAAIEASGKSQREISLGAGMAPGYVNSIFKEDKDPSITNLVAVCDQIGAALSFIVFGFDVTAEDEELLRLFQAATPKERAGLLEMLRARYSPQTDE